MYTYCQSQLVGCNYRSVPKGRGRSTVSGQWRGGNKILSMMFFRRSNNNIVTPKDRGGGFVQNDENIYNIIQSDFAILNNFYI